MPGGNPIQSAPLSEVTSDGLSELKQLIKRVLAERETLKGILRDAAADQAILDARVRRAQNWFWRLFLKSKIPERKAAAEAKKEEMSALEERLAGTFVDADFGLDENSIKTFAVLVTAFEQLMTCSRIWDLTESHREDRRVTRSAASLSLSRKPVAFAFAEDEILQTTAKVLRLGNANGPDLLLYPGFVMLRTQYELALVDLRELTSIFERMRFIEEEPVPSDAAIVGQSWKKTNGDGSRDRRFRDNYQIPVVQYGELSLRSPDGLNETYLLSDASKAEAFARALTDHLHALRAIGVQRTDTSKQARHEPSAVKTRKSAALKMNALKMLKTATAEDVSEASTLFQHFIVALADDLASANGSDAGVDTLEAFVAACASIPPAVQAFFARSPAVHAFQRPATTTTSNLLVQVLAQLRPLLEQLRQNASPEMIMRLDALVQRTDELLLDAKRAVA